MLNNIKLFYYSKFIVNEPVVILDATDHRVGLSMLSKCCRNFILNYIQEAEYKTKNSFPQVICLVS